jgi:hypothetical protein
MSKVNKYFQTGVPGVYAPEQNMLNDLIEESIQINGVEVFYIPRSLVSVDYLFVEDTLSKFENAYSIEMYLENTQGYDGPGSFLSKFGIEIQQTCTFTVSRRRWEETVGSTGTTILSTRPTEGDIIYLPLTKSMFEIKKVEHSSPFYQMGKLFVYRLDCELFKYSSEGLDTGIAEIDINQSLFSFSEADSGIMGEDGATLVDEVGCPLVSDDYGNEPLNGSQENIFDSLGQDILDFSEVSPFGAL